MAKIPIFIMAFQQVQPHSINITSPCRVSTEPSSILRKYLPNPKKPWIFPQTPRSSPTFFVTSPPPNPSPPSPPSPRSSDDDHHRGAGAPRQVAVDGGLADAVHAQTQQVLAEDRDPPRIGFLGRKNGEREVMVFEETWIDL